VKKGHTGEKSGTDGGIVGKNRKGGKCPGNTNKSKVSRDLPGDLICFGRRGTRVKAQKGKSFDSEKYCRIRVIKVEKKRKSGRKRTAREETGYAFILVRGSKRKLGRGKTKHKVGFGKELTGKRGTSPGAGGEVKGVKKYLGDWGAGDCTQKSWT